MPKTETSKRITVDLPAELHEKFSTKCFLSKPRLRMNQVIVKWIEEFVTDSKSAPRATRGESKQRGTR